MDLGQNLLALVNLEINALDKYQKTVEGFFGGKSRHLSAVIDFSGIGEDGEDITPDPGYMNMIEEEYREFYIEFPNHFRASFLGQICSFTESKLKWLCTKHYEFANPSYDAEKMQLEFLDSNNDMSGYMEYLKKKAKIDFSKIEKDWQFITIAYKIRNVFTHHSGIQRKIDKEEKKAIKGENKYYEAVDNFINKNEDLIRKHPLIKTIEKGERSEIVKDSTNYLILLESELNEKLVRANKRFFKNLLIDNLQFATPAS